MKNKLSIAFLVAAIVLIVTGTVMLLSKQDGNKKGEEKEKKKGNITYNAIFEIDADNSITSFKKTETDILVKIKTATSKSVYNTTIKDNKVVITLSKTEITLEYTEDGINVSKNDKIKYGLYKKTKDYTKEEFYSESFGNIDYVKSDLNYVYRKGESVLYLYEKEQDRIRLMCTFKDKSFDLELSKTGDYYSTEIFEEKYRVDIIDNGVKLTLDGDSLSDFDGSYTKDKKLEMDEIITLFTAA